MLVIAHRGNNKEELENSVSAYERAVESGAARIELDVQLSKDGAAVINHDDSLLHTTGHNLRCSDLNQSELKRIRLKNGEPLPFLDEIVERFLPRIELNIEIKGPKPELAAATAKLLKNSKYKEKIIISSFCRSPLLYMRDHAPDLQRACLVGNDEFEWPFFSNMSPLIFMQDVAATILHPRCNQVSEDMMDQARARGWKVYTWATMTGEDNAKTDLWTVLKSLGVDGHCTNYPRELTAWLKETRRYEQRVQELFRRS